MSVPPVIFFLWGDEFQVADLEEGWLVRFRDREVKARYLDRALAELLGMSPGSVLPLIKQILTAEPGSELSFSEPERAGGEGA